MNPQSPSLRSQHRPSLQSSPLNPCNQPTSAQPIGQPRRPSFPSNNFGRNKSSIPGTPRSTPRSPLAYLSDSPSLSISSVASSSPWSIRTPSFPGTAEYEPSVDNMSSSALPPPQFAFKKYNMAPPSPININLIRQRPELPLSPKNMTPRPSPLDHLDYLHNGPASPPMVNTHEILLEMPPKRNTDPSNQQSIASPFVNINSSPTEHMEPSPLTPAAARHARHPSLAISRPTLPHRRNKSLTLDATMGEMADLHIRPSRPPKSPLH
jgi:hypothetical protein